MVLFCAFAKNKLNYMENNAKIMALYQDPKTILQQRLNETLASNEEKAISELMNLALLKKANVDTDLLIYSEIYNLLGLEKFTELISLIDGRTLTLPSKDEFRETIIIILCFYYKEVKNYNWDEIKDVLADPNLNTVKIGIQISQFEKFLSKIIKKRQK